MTFEAPIPPITLDTEPAILALNNAHAVELSLLDAPRLSALIRRATYARRIGNVAAFMLAFDQAADYDSPNFLWFRARYQRFVYVDRVCVAPSARRRGYAGRLYADLFARATAAGHGLVTCEVMPSRRTRAPTPSTPPSVSSPSAARPCRAAARRSAI